jgi:dolichol-phosphate mannosyltransferase
MQVLEKLANERGDPFGAEPEFTAEQAVLPAISLVIPTRNEAANISELVRRIDAVAPDLPMEIIFADDSTDDTPAVIEAVSGVASREIRLLHRSPETRIGGLGGAVIAGMRIARAPWVCVMDADLQHPPEMIPRLFATATADDVDLVVASRYGGGGDADSFNPIRAAVSQGSTVAAHLIFPQRLKNVTDPMSGFFLVRRTAVDLDTLQPCGFKILLEIIGRTPGLRVASVPFHFGERFAGESKASLTEGWRYLKLLVGLRFSPATMRLIRFGMVGVSGLVVNSLVLAFATEYLGLFYLYSLLIATQCSTLWNFLLSEYWVFGRDQQRGRLNRGALFFVMNNLALGLRGPMVYVLTSVLSVNYLVSNVVSLLILMLLRFALADRVIWGAPKAASSYAAVPATTEGGIVQ